jgi:CheY-like chemotaxis protein
METRAQDQSASLLLLEDDWDHRNVFRDFLVHRGWTVLEATQAASARSLLASERIDVVVVDLGGTNGWALLEELGAQAARPWLICLTGDTRVESRDQAVALGADQYLIKPIALKRLADAVERLVGARGAPAAKSTAGSAQPTPASVETVAATTTETAGAATTGGRRPDDRDGRCLHDPRGRSRASVAAPAERGPGGDAGAHAQGAQRSSCAARDDQAERPPPSRGAPARGRR